MAQIAQPPIPGMGDGSIQTWIAAGGTYGLIGALVYAVRYLAKRDEKSTNALIQALGTALAESTKATLESTEQRKLARVELEAVKGRLAELEKTMHGRCPFLGVGDEEMKGVTARDLATRLIHQHEHAHDTNPPRGG